METAVL